MGFVVGRIGQTGPDIGGNTKSQEIRAAVSADARKQEAKDAAAPKPSTPPASDKPPEPTRKWNDKYSAVAYQTEKDVNFALVYEGFISTGLSESSSETSGKWSIEGNIHLVDSEKTKTAGKNVDKRVIAVKHTSDEPGTLYLEGKAYALGAGRVFVLGDAGEPFQTARTMALRSKEDLVKIGDAAMDDMKRAQPAAKAASPTLARDAWSAELLALSKVVAESRGMAEAKADDVIAWGAEEGGLRSGLLMPGRAKLGEKVTPLLVLKNVSGATKEMHVCTSLNVLEPTVHTADGKTFIETRKIQLTGADALFPVTLKVGEHIEFAGPPVLFGVGLGADGKPLTPDWPVAGVVMGAETVRVKFHLGNVRGPETGEVTVEVKVPGAAIRGKVLRPDGTAAAGVQVRVDDGIERWKFRGEGIPDLPKPVTTAADGTFSIEVPKHSAATNYEAFASSGEFAPLNAKVPAGGDVGVMQFAKGSRVTGRVFGLDGAGLAKVGIWCKQLDWHGRGPAPSKLTSTGADGTFSIPSIATGKYSLVILTRDLGAKELAVAFANPVIEAKDDAPVAAEIRPLPTVDLTLDARVLRGNVEFRDFELRVSGTLPGHKTGEPAAFWTRQETTKLTEGKHTIAVPAGLQNATVRADRIYMRKGDEPVFTWRREGDQKQVVNNTLELGLVDKPQTLGVTVQDAAK